MALWQEREPQSEWHEEREKASNDFRRVTEAHPKDVRKVVNAFNKIEKVEERHSSLLLLSNLRTTTPINILMRKSVDWIVC